MKVWRWLCVISLTLTAHNLLAASEPESRATVVYGEGALSCTDYLDARQDEELAYAHLAWLNGFLSAYDRFEAAELAKKRDIRTREPEWMMFWLAHYCPANIR